MSWKDVILNYGPLALLLVGFLAIALIPFVFRDERAHVGPSAFDEIKRCIDDANCAAVSPPVDTRTEKEVCLDEAFNVFQAWRCKRL